MDRPIYVPLTPGLVVEVGGRRRRVTHVLSGDSFLGVDLDTNLPERLRISDIEAIPGPEGAGPGTPAPDLDAVPDAAWARAQRRFGVIEPLLEKRNRQRSDVEAAAEAAGVDTATVYAWIKAFERSGHVSSLLPRKAGRAKGARLVDPNVEALIASAIERTYLTRQRRLVKPVIEDVEAEAAKANLKAPHPNTVRRRIKALDPRETARRRGERAELKLMTPAPGRYPETSYPLEVVQIDHTHGDVVVLDAERRPLGRPWITLAIDVHTRMVVGAVVGAERPNAATVGMCISQIMLPKGPVLAALGLPGDWPVWGRPEKILMDNAKEFDSRTVRRACEQYGIGREFRPGGTPEYGGHIERLMLTTARELHNIPGTTYSNTRERKDNDPHGEAVLTLDEFEAYLFDFLVNDYNCKPHSALGVPPLAKWKLAVLGTPTTRGTGVAPIPADPARVRIDFLPVFERTIPRTGVRIDKVTYYDAALAPYIDANPKRGGQATRKFLFRRDPRKITPIHFWDPRLGEHVPIPQANRSAPAISLWELRAAEARLRAEGRRHVNEADLMAAHQRRQRLVEDATAATKAARKELRRDAQRRRATERAVSQGPADPPNLRVPAPAARPAPTAADDIFSTPASRPAIIDLNPGRS